MALDAARESGWLTSPEAGKLQADLTELRKWIQQIHAACDVECPENSPSDLLTDDILLVISKLKSRVAELRKPVTKTLSALLDDFKRTSVAEDNARTEYGSADGGKASAELLVARAAIERMLKPACGDTDSAHQALKEAQGTRHYDDDVVHEACEILEANGRPEGERISKGIAAIVARLTAAEERERQLRERLQPIISEVRSEWSDDLGDKLSAAIAQPQRPQEVLKHTWNQEGDCVSWCKACKRMDPQTGLQPGEQPAIVAVDHEGKKVDCEKCGGAGWLWGHELTDASEDTRNDTMTKYSCDGEAHMEESGNG